MKKIISISLCAVLAACGGTRVVDLNNAADVQDMDAVMQLEYRDWTQTAENMTDSMLKSGGFAKIENPVIAIGDIKNDTMQRIDSDILVKKIRTTLVNSGRAQITTGFENIETTKTGYMPVKTEVGAANVNPFGATVAYGTQNSVQEIQYNATTAEDNTTHQVRDLRNNAEYDQRTIAKQGTLIAPNMSLTGKMIQRNIKLDSKLFSRVDTRVEYYLQLTLTDVKTGLSVWEDEQPIVKEGTDAPTW